MGLEHVEQTDQIKTATRNYRLTDEEELQLRKAEDELRRAKDAYDALEPLRRKRILSCSQRKRRPRTKPNENEIRSLRIASEKRAKNRALKRKEEMQNSLFFNGSGEDCIVEMSPDRLTSLFREIGSLDQFAKRLKTTRRFAIQTLRAAGVDVLEEIARAWEGGSSLRSLSVKHGPIPQTLSKWIKATGRQIKPRNSNQRYDPCQIRALGSKKWSTNRIATHMRLSWATVQKARSSGG